MLLELREMRIDFPSHPSIFGHLEFATSLLLNGNLYLQLFQIILIFNQP